MMWTRAGLKEKAKINVKRSYWGLVLMSFILGIINGTGTGTSGSSGSERVSEQMDEISDSLKYGASSFDWGMMMGIVVVVLVVVLIALLIGFVLNIFLFNPLKIGADRYFIEAAYGQKSAGEVALLGYAFSGGRYGNVVKTMFLKDLYQWLWGLLFVIPGIVKSYEYRMIPYILAENPDIDGKRAFELSRQMMQGEKWNAFILDLSFIGWILLGACTCGILLIFYVNPYIYMTDAQLYETLKRRVSSDYYDPSLSGPQYGAYTSDYYGNNDINYPGKGF